MKQHLLLITFLCLLGSARLKAGENPPASLSGTYLVGNSQTVYKKLTNVAAALNNAGNTITGNVIFELDSDYIGTSGETFPIVFKQFNSTGNWTVTIRPKLGVTKRTLSGAPADFYPLIYLQGADRLILDGRPGGTGSAIGWLIRNTTTSGAGPVAYIHADAQQNTLTWLQLEGQSASALVTIADGETEGNNNNTISYCYISGRSDVQGAPLSGILSQSGRGIFNSGTVITRNHFYNLCTAGERTAGINLTTGTTAATITYNHFYQTAAITSTKPFTSYNAIMMDDPAITDVNISNNFIGGSAPECGGSPFTITGTASNTVIIQGISLYCYNPTGLRNHIANNTIRNINLTSGLVSTGAPPFIAIQVVGPQAYITDNAIGSSTGHDDIKVTLNGGRLLPQIIQFGSKYGGAITGNRIGGITVAGTMGVADEGLLGIYAMFTPSASLIFDISNNTIGSATVSDNIRNLSTTMQASFSGISIDVFSPAVVNCSKNTVKGVAWKLAGTDYTSVNGIETIRTADVLIDSNYVSDLSVSSLMAGSQVRLDGIFIANASVISNNTVTGLHLLNEAVSNTSTVSGIAATVSLGNSSQVYNNKVYDLTFGGAASGSASLVGLDVDKPATVYNNLVSLDNDAGTVNCSLRGIRVNTVSATVSLFHNSVYIGGNNGSASNTAASAPVGRAGASSSTTLYLRNNLLVNSRTGGNGSHYIYYNAAATPATNWPATASDYNVLVAVNNARIARWGTSDIDSAQWRTNRGDAHSAFYTVSQLSPSVLFTDADAGDLTIREAAEEYVAGKGTSGTGITTDYAGAMRPAATPSAGAYEYVAGPPNMAPTAVALNPATINENAAAGTVVGTLAATDPDTGDSFTYTLVTGDSSTNNASFTIAGNQLKINEVPDYETKPAYSVRVRAADAGALFVEKAFIIQVANLNEHAPVITSHGGVATFSLNVEENQSVVTTVTATDADAGSEIVYSIVNSGDGGYFTINSSTGALAFVTAPDFEHPSDPDENNLFVVTVEASDGTFTAMQRLKVQVININDNAPEFGSYAGDAAVTLKIPENSTAVGTVWAVDKEPGTTITYSIASGQDGARFSINPVTGVLVFVTAPDFENPTDEYASNVYIVTVQASDGQLVSLQRFKIKITDVNEGSGRSSIMSQAARVAVESETGHTVAGIKTYPNPVTNKRFTLQMDSVATGRYTLEVYTLSGQLVHRQQLDHTGKSFTYPIQLPRHLTQGIYTLKVAGMNVRLTGKLIIE